MKIYLTGMPGSGKSSVGKYLADALNYTFFDIDTLIEKATSASIPELFRDKGESRFRELESQKLQEINTDHCVIATGGGLPLRETNRFYMEKTGVVYWLQASPKNLLTRLKNSYDRPLLKNTLNIDAITRILSKRTLAYEKADYYIPTDKYDIKQISDRIIRTL